MTDEVGSLDLFDYQDDARAETPVTDNAYKRLHELVDEYTVAKATAEGLEKQLAQAKQRFRNVAEVTLPEFLTGLNLTEVRTSNGLQVSLSEDVHANISEEREDEAIKWLDENGQSALVQRQFIVSFERDQEKLARRFAADLRRRKVQLLTKIVRKVHPSTLKAWVRRALSDGEAIPLATFGVHKRTIAKVSVAK